MAPHFHPYLYTGPPSVPAPSKEPFKISLAQWSLHRAFLAGEITTLHFPQITAETYNLHACELLNTFFKDKSQNTQYLKELKKRADDHNVKLLLIMCDHEGELGHPDEKIRNNAIANHMRWVEAARKLGCHSIRVNARSAGTPQEQQKLLAAGLHQLSIQAQPFNINILVENHGGLSSNSKWLVEIIKKVNLPNCGTLPDFGNFKLNDHDEYDRYQGVSEMMPYAKAVSAKSNHFNQQGEESEIDYHKMIKIVTNANYHSHLGIEYEGNQLSEHNGIIATKNLLQKIKTNLQ